MQSSGITPTIITKEMIEDEKAYLTYLAGLYKEEPSHLEFLAYLFGFIKPKANPVNRHHTRINKEQFKTIKSLLHYLDDENADDQTQASLKKTYERGSDKSTGLPIWVADSDFYKALAQNIAEPLPEEDIHFMEKFSEGGDKVKRFSDLAEDTISSAIRMPGGLVKIPENVVHGAVGGINLGNTFFEFIKGWWDAYVAYHSKDDPFRPENLVDAGMRISLSSTGIAICALYLTGFLLTPFALAGIAIVTLPIYLLPFMKNLYIYSELKSKSDESNSQEYENEAANLPAELERLKEELKNLEIKIEEENEQNGLELGLARQHISYEKLRQEYHAKKYQLACMLTRIANDDAATAAAWKDFKISAIELLGYSLVAAGSFLGLAIFITPAGPIVASIAFAAAVTGVGIITLCKFLPSIIARVKWAINNPRELLEKMLTPFIKVAGVIQLAFEKIHSLLPGSQKKEILTDTATTTITTTAPENTKPPGVIRRVINAIKNFSLHSKGKEYWSTKWDAAPGSSTIKAYQVLERYAHSKKTTHRSAVRQEYYKGNIPINSPDCRGAVAVLKKSLNNKPVKEKGDLHNMLQMFGEKDGRDYLSEFQVEKRPSLAGSIASFFLPRKAQAKQLLPERNRNGFTKRFNDV